MNADLPFKRVWISKIVKKQAGNTPFYEQFRNANV
jgi:hypothetical protein